MFNQLPVYSYRNNIIAYANKCLLLFMLSNGAVSYATRDDAGLLTTRVGYKPAFVVGLIPGVNYRKKIEQVKP